MWSSCVQIITRLLENVLITLIYVSILHEQPLTHAINVYINSIGLDAALKICKNSI